MTTTQVIRLAQIVNTMNINYHIKRYRNYTKYTSGKYQYDNNSICIRYCHITFSEKPLVLDNKYSNNGIATIRNITLCT